MLVRYCRYLIILAAVFAIPLSRRANPPGGARFPAGSGPNSKRTHDASGSAAAGKIISWTVRMAGCPSRGQPRSGKPHAICRRDLRGVRKMPVFHQLSEQIWRDIVANV
jgi:hypothetical protein